MGVLQMKKIKKTIWAIALILFLFSIIAITNQNYASNNRKSYDIYVVQQGDTLWSIACEYTDKGNPNKLVHAIRKVNGISAIIKPGEEIKIPRK